MSISESKGGSFGWELAIAALGGACLALILDPRDPALGDVSVHPLWIVGAVFAARYGTPGLVIVPLLAVALLGAELLSGGTGAATLARGSRAGDLLVLTATLLLAFVGAAHRRRALKIEHELAQTRDRLRAAETSVDELVETALALREQHDRLDLSLAFMSDMAARLDDPDPQIVGQAALELAMARSGAGAGFIQLLDAADRPRLLSARGVWGSENVRPPAVFRDVTAVAALARRCFVAAHEVPGVGAEDSDLAAPLLDGAGRAIGVIALRLVPQRALPVVREDLMHVARWAARRLAPGQPRTSREARHAAR